MAVSAYKDLSWGNEPVTPDKLNTMVNNSRYLFERAAKFSYKAAGINKDTNIKIASGMYAIPAPIKADHKMFQINFGNFFSVGCKPVIVYGMQSAYNGRVITTHYGFDGPSSLPDHRGFWARVAMSEFQNSGKNNYFMAPMVLNWMALGY